MNLKKFSFSAVALCLALQPVIVNALGSQFSYTPASQLASATLPQGQTHQYAYDLSGRVVQHSLPGGAGVGFAWDGQGNLASLTDPRGLATGYGVSGLGAVASVASPDTGNTSYAHNAAGLVTSRTDGRGTANYSWDALGRLLGASYADSNTTFAYDTTRVGKLGSMQDPSGSTGFAYDAQGRITSRTQVTTGPTGGAGATLALQQAYDSAGRLSQLTYPSGRAVTFNYDGARVTGISVDGASAISNVQYLPFGPPVSWQMGSVGAYSRTYNGAGQMASYTYENGQRTLTWAASNRVTGILSPAGVQWTYGYDNLDRLVSASESNQGVRSFALDPSGNRTSTTINGGAYSYGVDSASNRLSTSTAPSSAASYQYDAAGQILSDGARTFAWTKAGYLASAATGQGYASYSYNGFGQRVKKVTVSGGQASARHYLYAEDGVSLLGEYSQSSAAAQVGSLYEVVYLEGIPVLVLAGGQTYFMQSDHLNTPRTIKNAAGAVVWRWESDAFGIGAANQNPGGVMQFEFNLRLPGQQFDAETGLHYNNARYYDPVTGRYISSDPIGLAGGLNTYGYVGQAPTVAVDPTGNNALLFSARAGAVAGSLVWPGPGTIAGAAIGFAGAYAIGVGFHQWAIPANPVERGLTRVDNDSVCGGVVPVYVDATLNPEVAAHIEAAIAAGHPAVVTVDRPGAGKRRQESMAYVGLPAEPRARNLDRDEWPMAMFREGGAGSSVRYLNASQNRAAGRSIGNQCAVVQNGCPVKILIR